MAKIPLQKVRITGLRGHYKILMQELHRWGILEIIETQKFIEQSIDETEEFFGVLDLARIDFALKFLEPHQRSSEKMDSILSGGKMIMSEEVAKERLKNFSPHSEEIITECERIEERLVRDQNQLHHIYKQQEIISPFKTFHTPLRKDFSTDKSETWIGSIPASKEKEFVETLANESNLLDMEISVSDKALVYLRITVIREIAPRVQEVLNQFQFEALDIEGEFLEFLHQKPREVLRALEREAKELEENIKKLNEQIKELVVHLNDLRILYDYHTWGKVKNDLQHRILKTKKVFAFEAWAPVRNYEELEKWMTDIFVGEVSIEKIELDENEVPPTLIQNKRGFASYEAVTDLFGTPNKSDIDPTAYLAPFFFVFFGLCLSDVGYGGILTVVATYFLLFGTFSRAAKDGILLLLFCGIGAVLGGIFLGGYFGMTPDQSPAFLLTPDYLAGVEGVMPFRGQMLDPMSGSGPILFLGIAMVLGVIQLLTGLVLDFYRKIINKAYVAAFCDPFAWFYFLVVLLGFAIADHVGLPKEFFKNLTIAGAIILIITQGRDQKNWFLKPFSGILGLYNIMGYISDLLSYSRLMALGLATGVIGFAMNLTAGILGDMMPNVFLGFIVSVAFLIFGHSLNFALSTLGAFVHSGRLQFIEFFSKFFEGDGQRFQPFARQKKYLFFKNP